MCPVAACDPPLSLRLAGRALPATRSSSALVDCIAKSTGNASPLPEMVPKADCVAAWEAGVDEVCVAYRVGAAARDGRIGRDIGCAFGGRHSGRFSPLRRSTTLAVGLMSKGTVIAKIKWRPPKWQNVLFLLKR
jgi:hypothetical protein